MPTHENTYLMFFSEMLIEKTLEDMPMFVYTGKMFTRVKHKFNTCLTYKKTTRVEHIKRAHVLNICIKHM